MRDPTYTYIDPAHPEFPVTRYPAGMHSPKVAAGIRNLRKGRKVLRDKRRRLEKQQARSRGKQRARFTGRPGQVVVVAPRAQKEIHQMSNPFAVIGKGVAWFGKEVWHVLRGAGDKFLALAKAGKLITVAEDGEKIVTDGAAKVATLIEDTVALGAAVSKDDAASIAALENIVLAASAAAEEKLVNPLEDAALVNAVISFLKTCKTCNFTDVISTIKQVAVDAQQVGSAIASDFEKLIGDAK